MNQPNKPARGERTNSFRLSCKLWVSVLLATLVGPLAQAHGDMPQAIDPPVALRVKPHLPPLSAGTTQLKFKDFFQLPVGERGLQPTPLLRQLNGHAVRIVGYQANTALPAAGLMILAPIPIVLGDEDERLVDDLPPQAVFVHLSPAYAHHEVPNFRGLLHMTGVLQLGAYEEADGHVSMVRLVLDDATSKALVQGTHASAEHPERVAVQPKKNSVN